MEITANGLVKPGQDDYYNVDNFNRNTDVIDGHLEKEATASDLGHVKIGSGLGTENGTVSVKLADNLETDDSTAVLSAAMGKQLSDMLTNQNSGQQTIVGQLNGNYAFINYNKRGNILWLSVFNNNQVAVVAAQEYVIAVLPEGYRPSETYSKAGICGQSCEYVPGYIKVKSNGEVSLTFVNSGMARIWDTNMIVPL